MVHVGQRLKEARLQKKLSLEEVAKATKIRAPFLSALERGDYLKLPSSTYAHGFVSNYAEFLGLPKKEILALFRREFDEEKEYKVLPDGLTQKDDFPIRRINIRQILIVACILLLIGGYIFYQYRGIFINPSLEISKPEENAVISSKEVQVIGKTTPNTTVYVDETLVPVDTSGSFKKNISVFPGKVTIIIRAQNKFGKETTQERIIEVRE